MVATLTITSVNVEDIGHLIEICNAAYTITTNFDAALSITIPLYTWGDYEVKSRYYTKKITISPVLTHYQMLLSELNLFDNGDQCTDITGGYIFARHQQTAYEIMKYLTIIQNETGAGGWGTSYLTSKNLIDTSLYNTMIMKYTLPYSSGSGFFVFGLFSSNVPGAHHAEGLVTIRDSTPGVAEKTIEIDLSSTNTKGYIGIASTGDTYKARTDVSMIKLA